MRLYLTTQQLDIAREAIEAMKATGGPIPVVRRDQLILPAERAALDGFLHQVATAIPESVALAEGITERKRQGKTLAARNLAERVRGVIAVGGEGLRIPHDGMPIRFRNILAQIGVETIQELETWTEEELRQVRGMGEHGIAAVNKILARFERKLRTVPPVAATVARPVRCATPAAEPGRSPRVSSRRS